ncbi:MAG: ABC transporter permease [Terracidiphilus sp.]|nr:ABC transporter permease [Terracidiphilus sp.]
MMKEWLTRLRFMLFRRKPQELDEELRFHVEQATEARIAAGMTPEEARRQALIEFGGVERTREQCHEQRPGWWMGTVAQDVRYGLRGFRRNPVFTVAVIATLAVGIGATTAVFSVVDRILFRALPYAHDDRLVSVGLVAPIIPQEFMLGGSYYEWRDNQKAFEAFTSETGARPCDLTERNPARLSCASVEQNFLPTLGISPQLGRNFLPEEDRPNGPKAALISYDLWRSHYGLDPGILNRLIDIDGSQVRVIGVLPRDFEMPALEPADIVVPQALDEAMQRKADPGAVMYAFARLKPGINLATAEAALQPVFNYSLNLAPPQFRKEVHLRVRSIRDRQVHDVRLLAWILFGAVVSVLLIACANVASLLLARARQRERELAVRFALGASRGRLLRQTLTEALLLSLGGALAGCAMAVVLLRVFVDLAPAGIPFLSHAQLDLRIIGFTFLLSLTCGLLFGTLPALHAPRPVALAGRMAGGETRVHLRRCLVVTQIAISMVLLTGAALLLRSFRNLEQQGIGMDTRGVLAVRVPLPRYRYTTPQKRMDFFLRAEQAMRRLPGVLTVGMSDSLPPGGTHGDQIFSIMAVEGKPKMAGGTGGMVAWRWVTPEYFSSLDIPIVRGQAFTAEERTGSQRFLILSSLLAARLFGSEDPVGKQLQLVPNGPWYAVAGIAANVKNAGLAGDDEPEYYRLRRNVADDWNADAVLVVKTGTDPEAAEGWIRSQIGALDATVPVEMETLSRHVSKLADRPRFETSLLGFFAFCGLLMAVIGLYGVISFVATQRTQEIGVRMALGATRLDILRLIVGEGARLIVVGGVLGLGAALGAAQLLKSLLFNVGPWDPATYAGVTLLLALVALAATLIPARAAMKVEPVVALRYE